MKTKKITLNINKSKEKPKKTVQNSRLIRLESINFSEFLGESNEWVLETINFNQINLIVGKNSSGKSRILNIIAGLANLLSGKAPRVYSSGNYVANFTAGQNTFAYILNIKNGQVISEKLTYDGKIRLDRGKNGSGKIWAVKINDFIEFESPTDQLAARTRRDGIQHPFFNDLHDFSNQLRHYQFGSPLGKDRLLLLPDINSIQYKNNEIIDTNEVVKLYTSAFEEFGEKFDSLVLEDFNSLGYNCSDVGAEYADSKIVKLQGAPVLWLFVQEKGLKSKTTQWTMSQGMFRALSLVIHINYCILRKLSGVVLIDDIGEGLDYSRSKSFIDLLIKKSEKNNLQLIMTTNDRFIMNGVPLRHWAVVDRVNSKVKLVNQINSPQIFEDFEDLGLNNFDFFASNFFKEGMK